MINKRNVLGKAPFDLGDKDAIHVAIASVRAASFIKPGNRCQINEFGEAEPSDSGPGVADPFRTSIARGDSFWMLLDQDEVPNVRHVWEHPSVKFDKPTRPAKLNQWLERNAKSLGVTYDQLLEACAHVVNHYSPMPYPTAIDEDDLEKLLDKADQYDIWSEWGEETGHEFENNGSACCPEYDYPDTPLFCVGETE